MITRPRIGWLFVLPALVVLAAFTLWPAVGTLLTSFQIEANPVREGYTGLGNFEQLFGDPIFRKALTNNLLFALGTVPTSIAIALGMALAVNGGTNRWRGFNRLAFFSPSILPVIAAANIWLFFYAPEIGAINSLLGWFGIEDQNWLGSPSLALPSLIVMMVWKEAGFFMIFFLAALQQIPPELGDAAALEGAGRGYYLRKVTLPLLMPTTIFVFITALINSFKTVDQLFILTRGGPNNATQLILYYVYENAFSFFRQNYAATVTVALLLILASLSFVQLMIADKRAHYR